MIDFTRDMNKLNSLTKYPSIETYHTIGAKGRFTDEHIDFGSDTDLVVTEKVDGVNGRIVFLPKGDFLLGCHEEFVYARGDRVGIPNDGVMETLKPIATRIADTAFTEMENHIVVAFGEVYGRGSGSEYKRYSKQSGGGFRVFDLLLLCVNDIAPLLEMEREKISSWRQHGGQEFSDELYLCLWCAENGLQTTPRIATLNSFELPVTHEGVLEWLKRLLPASQCTLDDSGDARPEGVVVRTMDRKQIVKIRYQDYERNLRSKLQGVA